MTLIGQALADLKPATARLQPRPRRLRHEPPAARRQGRRCNSPYPDGPVDHDVPVLRIDGADGKLRAVLFGYACHNTTLSFYQFCGDYAGYAQEYFEKAHPGVTALFMTGCGGDQNPYPRGTLELAQQHGRSAGERRRGGAVAQAEAGARAAASCAGRGDARFRAAGAAKSCCKMKESKDKGERRRAELLARRAGEDRHDPREVRLSRSRWSSSATI